MKIFGIGLQRTGTTSLSRALNILGIKTKHFPSELLYDLNSPIIQQFDGFTDNPIPLLYQELDRRYPNSKFIHTVRDEDEWLKSMRWLFSNGSAKFEWQHGKNKSVIREMHLRLYGTTSFDEAAFVQKYRAYNRDVNAYFANRPGDLLVFNMTLGDGFEKLCSFVGKPVPREPFPHRNKTEPLWKVYARKIKRKTIDRLNK